MKTQNLQTNTKFDYYQRIADELTYIEDLEYRAWKTQKRLEKEDEYVLNFAGVAEAEFFVKHVNNAALLRAELTKLEEDITDRQYRVDSNLARIDATEFFAYMKQKSEKKDSELLQMLEQVIQDKDKNGNGLNEHTEETIQLLAELHTEIKGLQPPQ